MTTAPGPVTTTRAERGLPGGVGDSPARPDGRQKVTGEFAYSSDLWLDGMLWGATVRSPHPRARLIRLDISGALTVPGVAAVLTHEDVPGARTYGLEHKDQPVLAWDQVRYQGEPVALVAADHPETARRAAARIGADYEVLPPVTGARAALDPDAPALHEGGNLVRHVRIRKGHPDTPADVVVHGEYQVGMQDQAFLGPESGLAVPAADGGVDLFVATQWLHVDRDQIAASLGLPGDKVRITLSGVGGAFGAREDLSMQIHACLLALRTGKPVKMVYSREESFFGHVHRHPASLRYEHGSTADGRLVYVKADIVLDGGAYASSSPAVAANAATLGVGPYEVPHVAMDCYAVYTNNPPCGAMRGFGAVQACFAYETQMDKLAAALGMDPVELRIRNAMREGSVMPTGQVVDSAAPVAEILKLVGVPPAAARLGRVRGRGPAHDAGRSVQHHPRRRHRPRRRLRRRHQERRLLRRLRRLLHGQGAPRAGRRRAGRAGAHGRRRGRAGPGHRAGPDRQDRARRAARGHPARRHLDRQRRLHLGVPADLRDRRRGAGRVPRGAGAAGPPRAGALRRPGPRPAPARPAWPSCSTSRPSRR